MAIFSTSSPYPAKPANPYSISTFMVPIKARAGMICDEIKTSTGDIFATKQYVDNILGLADDMYFPHDHQKQLRELLLNVSNEDAKAILHLLFMELTKDNKELTLASDVEAAIISMKVDII